MLAEKIERDIKAAQRGREFLLNRANKNELDDSHSNVMHLAQLAPIAYDQSRKTAAEKLCIRVETLDREVEKIRSNGQEKRATGYFNDPEPWSTPVNGNELLNNLSNLFSQYLALPEHGETILSLWTLHTHALDAFFHSPRLNARSAEKGSGKTTLLDLLSDVCPNALRLDNATTAITFRLVDEFQPTLLIDEHDTFLRGNEELRGALNSGHRRGGVFPRCVGDNNDVKLFKVFAATALAGIGRLPDTLQDRAITIEMKRARPGEVHARYDSRKIDNTLKRKCSRWAIDNLGSLKSSDPELPEQIYNRAADNWRSLIAIADLIGGEWPDKVRLAAINLSAIGEDDSVRVLLLTDIRDLFKSQNTDRLTSAEIVEILSGMETRPWPEWKNGKPITTRQLASLLRPFHIIPGTIRTSNGTAKGYTIDAFTESFSRYLPEIPPFDPSQRHNVSGTTVSADFTSVTGENALRIENPLKPASDNACDGVTDRKLLERVVL